MTVNFRGQEAEISFRDYGYEPETGAHPIDWDFTDPDFMLLEFAMGFVVTEDEEVDICRQICDSQYQRYCDE